MPPPTSTRRQLLRRLHEHYHVPIAMLADLGEYATVTVENLAQTERWRTTNSPAALRAQLADVTFRAMIALEGSDEEAALADRTLKHIGTISKAVETLAVAEGHLNKPDGRTDTDTDDDPSLAVGGGSAIAQLDRMAAELARDFDLATAAVNAEELASVSDAALADDEPAGAEPRD